ncbi:hypothetical protein Vi05172_g11029 [Venturia inaequalis]|nr:hypothetical protein Vi05172_g11029 [Venturia inaequalis]
MVEIPGNVEAEPLTKNGEMHRFGVAVMGECICPDATRIIAPPSMLTAQSSQVNVITKDSPEP